MIVPFSISSIIQTFGYPAIFLGEGLEGIGIPFPGETTLLAASIYAASSGQMNIVLIIAVSTIGAFAGDNLGYLIGRNKGYQILLKYGHRWGIKEDKIERSQEYFKKHGPITVFIGRFTTLLRIFSPLLAGISKMNYAYFAAFNFLGCLCWSILYGVIGYAFGKNLDLLYKIVKEIGFGTLFIVLFILIMTLLIFIYRGKNKIE